MKKILFVEDDSSLYKMYSTELELRGYQVVWESNGANAFSKAQAEYPDLILLDLMLPKLNGFELLRELQEDDTSDIPIVIITGRNTNPSTRGMMKREPNVKGFMEKPVKQHVLAALMYTLLKTQKQ